MSIIPVPVLNGFGEPVVQEFAVGNEAVAADFAGGRFQDRSYDIRLAQFFIALVVVLVRNNINLAKVKI